ncbi:signal recognition particle-docking protein FtsY [Romboutsia lituseburensis]|uniref:Signal recognition particle receptor FtsY n=1 Tax=Romboutsia lituseburensis DSM 797 TaxID=1121325 RepID=A0A1G9Q5J7_9FIRM|nr:signal recognition particle-docking protein FtsY [Romboutsia lituseburensis]CEH35351.1 Signal recognition particle receptor FtsY [Romboutsia lituseburensis]SDM06229.1 signal recognition particle-docking protein FtsY [Romboutsia lituseburensis DSM 797]
MFKKLFKFGKKKEENQEVQDQSVETNESIEDIKDQDQVSKEAKENKIIDEVENKQDESFIEENKDVEKVISDEDIKDKIVEENIIEGNEVNKIENDNEKIIDDSEVIDESKIDANDTEIEVKEEIIEDIKEEQEGAIEDIEEEQEEPIEDVKDKKVNLFDRLKQGLTKAKQGITDRIDDVLKSYTKVDEELLEELEEILITADVGVNTTMDIVEQLRDKIKEKKITDPMDVRVELKTIVENILTNDNSTLDVEHSPTIILMVGVNGVGKTTTIGKLANRYKQEGKKVLLAAGDTFRAAAIEQLEVWASRSNVDIIKHQEGADPGAVVFDAVKAAKARNVDLLICDTAGRLHNKANLMNELGKVFKIVDREFPEAKKEVLLVVDATTGQNAVVQAKTFKEVADITGIVLTKLDGTAKGGVVLAVKSEVDVPVKLIGVGEKVEDLQDFDAKSFSDALFGN